MGRSACERSNNLGTDWRVYADDAIVRQDDAGNSELAGHRCAETCEEESSGPLTRISRITPLAMNSEADVRGSAFLGALNQQFDDPRLAARQGGRGPVTDKQRAGILVDDHLHSRAKAVCSPRKQHDTVRIAK